MKLLEEDHEFQMEWELKLERGWPPFFCEECSVNVGLRIIRSWQSFIDRPVYEPCLCDVGGCSPHLLALSQQIHTIHFQPIPNKTNCDNSKALGRTENLPSK